jgi:CheY-like chemotaxis protein
MLKEGKFDIILMDVEMPEMSGIEATRVIRKTEAGTKQHIPIVAMTAYAMKEDRQRCLDAGMDTYISKPVNLDELHKIIKDFTFVKSNETPAVDIEAALKFVGGLEEILKDVVSVFLDEDYPEQLKRLKEGCIQQNAGMVKEAAHSIKGAVRSLGGTVPGEKALRLEEMGRNNTLEEADNVIKELEQDISRFKEFYANYNWQENK